MTLLHTPFVLVHALLLFRGIVLSFNFPSILLTFEIACATFSGAWGDGGVGLGEETFGFFVGESL
jgi:hypothetical protein